MNSEIAKEVINVIRSEQSRRSHRLKNEDPDVAYDQWLFLDEPFISEMCLMALVALRHQVERELVFLAARTNCGGAIARSDYWHKVGDQRAMLRKKEGWKELESKLNLHNFGEWAGAMKTLRLLANNVKHDPWQLPDEKLLRHLGLPTAQELKPPIVGYMPLPESACFREGLASSISLPKDSDYCSIAEEFVELARQFLEKVLQSTRAARVIPGRISMALFGC